MVYLIIHVGIILLHELYSQQTYGKLQYGKITHNYLEIWLYKFQGEHSWHQNSQAPQKQISSDGKLTPKVL